MAIGGFGGGFVFKSFIYIIYRIIGRRCSPPVEKCPAGKMIT
jgi:hypothetical protein